MRQPRDYYPTPYEVLLALRDEPTFASDAAAAPVLVDPFAGDGRVLVSWPYVDWSLWDIEPQTSFVGRRDSLAPEPWGLPGGAMVVTNPPYSRGEKAIRRCIEEAATVWALLPLSYLCGVRRRAWVSTENPDVWPLARRPRFVGKATDTHDVAWFRVAFDACGRIGWGL